MKGMFDNWTTDLKTTKYVSFEIDGTRYYKIIIQKGKFIMIKYVRVMDGIKSNAGGFEYQHNACKLFYGKVDQK